MNARISYRESAVRGATPVQLVIALYEQVLDDLRRALAAFEKKDIEDRTRSINHALVVIGQLQASLNMTRGGNVAQNLQRFYNMVRTGLLQAHIQQSVLELKEQIAHVMLVHDAWVEVEQTGIDGGKTDRRESARQEKDRKDNETKESRPAPAQDSSLSFAEWDA